MALASNPGLLRAHCWIQAKKKKGHTFYCFIISPKLKVFRLEDNITLLEIKTLLQKKMNTFSLQLRVQEIAIRSLKSQEKCK